MEGRRICRYLSAICAVVAIAAISEAVVLDQRLKEARHPLYHRHADVRKFIIRVALADIPSPIVVYGDSITEMARLPQEICGHQVINAGIGGMSIGEAAEIAPDLFQGAHPYLIVSALGGNDIGGSSAGRHYRDLLSALDQISEKLVAVSVISDVDTNQRIAAAAAAHDVSFFDIPVRDDLKMTDRVHFTAAGYRVWLPAVEAAIRQACTG
jgi:hypothetical protein